MFGRKKRKTNFLAEKIRQQNLNQKLLDQTYETNFQEKYLVAKFFDEKLMKKLLEKIMGKTFGSKPYEQNYQEQI
jgi:hypothetical protein